MEERVSNSLIDAYILIDTQNQYTITNREHILNTIPHSF